MDDAFAWLCRRRQDYSHNSDVWNLRRDWHEIKQRLQATLLAGTYTFQPLQERRFHGESLELWSARDALVLKALALVLSRHLEPRLSPRCYHLAGRGGAKAAVRAVSEALNKQVVVMKSDVKDYYASMDHWILFAQVQQYVTDNLVLRLIRGYLKRTVCLGENYREVQRGICIGCPLSPLMGALYLTPLDEAMEHPGLFYARFMDDWIILAPTRWKLREAVRAVNQVLTELKIDKHPGKTFVGKLCRGFDFLGYHFLPGRLSVSQPTLRRLTERLTRLYEQGADSRRAGQYVWRWMGWARAGVTTITLPRLSAAAR